MRVPTRFPGGRISFQHRQFNAAGRKREFAMLFPLSMRSDTEPDRPDIDIRRQLERVPDQSRAETVRRAALIFAGAAVAVLLGAVLLFVPILIGELSRVDGVLTATGIESAADFAARLRSLFYGAVIVSSAIISFIMSFLLAPFEPRFHTPSDYRFGLERRPRRTDAFPYRSGASEFKRQVGIQ
ncbi:hypothetical protein H2509_01190 [Stappia sp. F7233]|uniref:Uncharacterized protein n=1 Tax=Stappia albiluteola TaxID=2758565 RepID=A0A839A9L6_9HYPH|nr:hypothetical protein [Stappia albiluteola]MBA5775734.1 hypothetical protein [Stappia albiluteola]